ncbi:MAG: FdtA/QdtA family cupin domain-containing protein [Pseudomonadota bacterium]
MTQTLPPKETVIEGVYLDVAPQFDDARGSLLVREAGHGLPFVPKRMFYLFDVPEGSKRGDHAHRTCHQLLICLKGRVECVVDNGHERASRWLDSSNLALYMPPMVWGIQQGYSKDAILLVLASHEFDPDDYIRSYNEFKSRALQQDRP